MNKIDRLLDAVEHPEHFTDDELNEILSNNESEEYYDLMCDIRSSFLGNESVDVNAEWAAFVKANSEPRHKFVLFLRRHAAAVIIVAVVSLVSVGAAVGIGSHVKPGGSEMHSGQAAADTVDHILSGSEVSTEDTDSTAETVLFKNEPLEKIIADIAKYYNVDMRFENEDSKRLRLFFCWDKNMNLQEVVEQLNGFEQFKVTLRDNILTID